MEGRKGEGIESVATFSRMYMLERIRLTKYGSA